MRRMRAEGKRRWYPVVYLLMCRGEASIQAVKRMRWGSLVMAALEGLVVSAGVR